MLRPPGSPLLPAALGNITWGPAGVGPAAAPSLAAGGLAAGAGLLGQYLGEQLATPPQGPAVAGPGLPQPDPYAPMDPEEAALLQALQQRR